MTMPKQKGLLQMRVPNKVFFLRPTDRPLRDEGCPAAKRMRNFPSLHADSFRGIRDRPRSDRV